MWLGLNPTFRKDLSQANDSLSFKYEYVGGEDELDEIIKPLGIVPLWTWF